MASLKSLADLACLLPVVSAKPKRKPKAKPAKAKPRPSAAERDPLPSGEEVFEAMIDAAETLPDYRPPVVRMTPERRRIEKAMDRHYDGLRELEKIKARRPVGVPSPQLEPKSIHSPAGHAMIRREAPKFRGRLAPAGTPNSNFG